MTNNFLFDENFCNLSKLYFSEEEKPFLEITQITDLNERFEEEVPLETEILLAELQKVRGKGGQSHSNDIAKHRFRERNILKNNPFNNRK